MSRSVVVKDGTVIPAEPISLAEAKLHLRYDETDQDALITALIQAAREWAENYCRRSFVRRTLELRMDFFPAEIRLPSGPVASVTHIKYIDFGGTLTTLAGANYQADIRSTPPRIIPVFGATWPTVKPGTLSAVLVEYEAGYAPGDGSPTDYGEFVPEAIKAAIKLIVGHLYENRELTAHMSIGTLPFAVKALLAPYEIRDFTLEQ